MHRKSLLQKKACQSRGGGDVSTFGTCDEFKCFFICSRADGGHHTDESPQLPNYHLVCWMNFPPASDSVVSRPGSKNTPQKQLLHFSSWTHQQAPWPPQTKSLPLPSPTHSAPIFVHLFSSTDHNILWCFLNSIFNTLTSLNMMLVYCTGFIFPYFTALFRSLFLLICFA